MHEKRAPGAGALGFALAGFLLLSCGDAVIKSMAGQWPGTAVAALRFAISAIGLGTLLLLAEGRAAFVFPRPRLQLARGVALAFSTQFFFLALFAMPLAEATTIGFINPILAALFSLVLLGERQPRAIWPAILLGFAGVLLVLRPNVAEIGWAGLFPFAAAIGFSLMLVLNRMGAADGSVLKMQFAISAVAAPLLIVAAAIGHWSGVGALRIPPPDWTVVARCVVVAVSATCSHALIYVATSRVSAGTVAPMVYVQLLMAMLLGAVFYREFPDVTALAGAGLVIAGGLFLWWKS